MKKNTIGGFVVPRGYRHIQKYEEEILRLKEEGKTCREIGKNFGFSYEQVHNLISRYNARERKIEAGIAIKRKGRPPKDYQISEEDKAAQLRYIIFHQCQDVATHMITLWHKIFLNPYN